MGYWQKSLREQKWDSDVVLHWNGKEKHSKFNFSLLSRNLFNGVEDIWLG